VLIRRRGRRRRPGEAAQKLLEELARDFGTSAPKLRVVGSPAERLEACGDAEVAGCYRFKEGVVVLSEEMLESVETLLHEYAHHLQLALHDGDWRTAFADTWSPHCRRRHEAEAKAFASWLTPFYKRRFEKILEGSEGGADRERLCGHIAAIVEREVGRRAPKLLEEAKRGAWHAVGELYRLADNVGFMLSAARRACGLDASSAVAVDLGLGRVAGLAEKDAYAEAEEELEWVKGELSRILGRMRARF